MPQTQNSCTLHSTMCWVQTHQTKETTLLYLSSHPRKTAWRSSSNTASTVSQDTSGSSISPGRGPTPPLSYSCGLKCLCSGQGCCDLELWQSSWARRRPVSEGRCCKFGRRQRSCQRWSRQFHRCQFLGRTVAWSECRGCPGSPWWNIGGRRICRHRLEVQLLGAWKARHCSQMLYHER